MSFPSLGMVKEAQDSSDPLFSANTSCFRRVEVTC